MLLALGLLVLGMVGTSTKPAYAATKIVTKSFHNTNQINIPESTATKAALPYPSLISPTFPKGTKVRDVNVTLRNYTHTYPDDVDVLLAHAGKNRTIMSDVGASLNVNSITIRLDDEASNGLLPDAGQLTAGAFKPTNRAPADTFPFPAPDPASANTSLAGFDTLNARGAWKLFVVDDFPEEDSGKFAGGWTVTIRAAVPQ
jgi:hypothetical protein